MKIKSLLKISMCQLQIKFETKDYNIKRAEEFILRASGNSDMILFPEMSFTGFSMNAELTGEEANETVNKLSELAKKYNIAIGFGWVKGKAKAENHYTVVNENGLVIADYVKIHPFSYSGENEHFTGGNSTCTFEYKGVTIGVSICYDLRFPELYQELSKTAEVILVPANWPERRSEHWKTLLKARAIENQSYVLGINCYGYQEELFYSGDSLMIRPDGQEGCLLEGEAMEMIEIFDDVKAIRDGFPVKHDRKIELYRKYYE